MNLIQKQFYAFYESDLPNEVLLNQLRYRKVHTFKYDFFAGTGMYELAEENIPAGSTAAKRVVVKIYRFRRFFGLPMSWMGKMFVGHEARLYRMLEGIEGIPRFEGFINQTGFAHEYIAGRPLKRLDIMDDRFFDHLKKTLEDLHAKRASYVDLHKLENIILGDDGKPYLVDFQISYAPRLAWPIIRTITDGILRKFQREDWYHYIKHKRRLRWDLATPEEIALSKQASFANRVHRVVSKPYFWIRHRVMNLLGLESVE